MLMRTKFYSYAQRTVRGDTIVAFFWVESLLIISAKVWPRKQNALFTALAAKIFNERRLC